MLETFVDQVDDNYTHFALSRTIANDTGGARIRLVSDAYKQSIALCDTTTALSQQAKRITKLKLGFWLGRLLFISGDSANLKNAITIWEDLLKDFLLNPAVADLENVLPLATHLCSAYVQTVLQNPASSETERIISQVNGLRDTAAFSQDSLSLKLRFRTSLCLARIYVARDSVTEARDVLSEHVTSAFVMILQRSNKPLASIGWLYLASILTVLGQDLDRAAWAWSKVQLHQPDRWTGYDGYKRASASSLPSSLDTPLTPKHLAHLDAIKRSEEYAFWDGPDKNSITSAPPDRYYLPLYATLGCAGRACRAASANANDASQADCDPLQVPAQYTNELGSFTPAQNKVGRQFEVWQKVPFWACRECVAFLLCGACYGMLREGRLLGMGCKKDHEGVFVDAKVVDGDPYAVDEEDVQRVLKEKKGWEGTEV